MKPGSKIAGAAVVAALVVGGAVAVSTQPSPSACQPDPAAAIAATPAGGKWQGSGCYDTAGILLAKPITMSGGTFYVTGDKPGVRIKDTSKVNVAAVSIIGTHTKPGYNRTTVGQEGIQVLSSTDVSISNVATKNTGGDGLIFGFQPRHPPSSNVSVDGYTITNTGRQGVTVAYLEDSTLSNVNIVSSADVGWDFESDVGAGSGFITVNHATGEGVHLIEALNGPVTFNSPNISGNIGDTNSAALSQQPVMFNGGTINLHASFHGTPPAGITIKGPGIMFFAGVTIGRIPSPKPPTGLAWSVTGGGRLTFMQSVITPPLGTNDSTSTVIGAP